MFVIEVYSAVCVAKAEAQHKKSYPITGLERTLGSRKLRLPHF
jgi:hypothetical protein